MIATTSKIFVGLSGGVDSAVSAALLKQAGNDVVGVFIKVWQPDWIECTWKDDRRDAMRAAAHLGIPFIGLDLEKEYKQGVIDHMITEYASGRTPNPDVMCNREVKFGAFWRYTKEQGADFIATGHYARIQKEEKGTGKEKSKTGQSFHLLKGADPNKDQSYFLWTLKQDDLAHALFPVGHLLKPQVRELARKFGLPNAEKKDSQGLCFIGKVDIKEFLAHYARGKPGTGPGKVLQEGTEIGSHPGALFFTIGERHGFSVGDVFKTPHDRPFYVVGKDMRANTISVSNKDQGGQLSRTATSVRLSSVNWISEAPTINGPLQARSRYRQVLSTIKVKKVSGMTGNLTAPDALTATVGFDQPQDSLTPGQSLVMYDGDVCVGGGIIE